MSAGFCHKLADVEIQRLRYAETVSRIGAEKVADLTQLDFPRHGGHVSGDVAKETLLLLGRKEAEEIPRLRVIVVALAVIVAVGIAGDFQWWLVECRAILRAAEGVGLVVDRTAAVERLSFA